MKKIVLIIIFSLILCSCASNVLTYSILGGIAASSSLKYGFLPGVKCPIYDFSKKQYDICQYYFKFNLIDKRQNKRNLSCSQIIPETDSEFEGEAGYNFFKTYFDTLIKKANGIIDSSNGINDKKIDLNIEIISPKLIGFGFIKVHGLCQINVTTEFFTKTYCCDIKDGDDSSPLEWYSFDTRKSALRKMTSASIRNCIEDLISDLELNLRKPKQKI
jgi:hypothetical protein